MKTYVDELMVVKAIKTIDNQIIPIWSNELIYETNADGSSSYVYLKNNRSDGKYFEFIDCIFNLKTKEICLGIELDFYNPKQEYSKGDIIYYDNGNRVLTETKIDDVLYETFEYQISYGNEIDSYYKNNFNNVIFEDDKIYCIKIWKPTYLITVNNKQLKTIYTYNLYKKQ